MSGQANGSSAARTGAQAVIADAAAAAAARTGSIAVVGDPASTPRTGAQAVIADAMQTQAAIAEHHIDPARRPDVFFRVRREEGHVVSVWWPIGAFVGVSTAVILLLSLIPGGV